jgi:hypothetical protein
MAEVDGILREGTKETACMVFVIYAWPQREYRLELEVGSTRWQMTYVVLAAGNLQPSNRYIHIHLTYSTPI